MALDSQKLIDGLKEAFEKGKETQDVSGGEDGEVEAKYTEGDVAGFLADAIVDYASDAEILLLPGPLMIPAAPPVPDIPNLGSLLQPQTTDVGKPILKASIEASFTTKDPIMSLITTGITSYIAISFTSFMGFPGNTAVGTTVPVFIPVLAPCTALGMAGAEQDEIIELMAVLIHTAFKSSVFNGSAISVFGGIGPIIAQPLL
jgi:hypothetical protein